MEKIILTLEPDSKMAEKLYQVFRKERFAVKTTERASEAIRSIQEEHVAVLIVDVGVKDMTWDEVVPIVKGLDPKLPIILTSEHNTPELEASILHQKVFYYHVKSFGNEELILAVQNAIERHMSRGKKPPREEEEL
jgi:two-component system C4-dicarboxylate transport response regulator DctD